MRLKYRLSDESVEDEFFVDLELAINKYVETNPDGNRGTLTELARLIEDKLPKNSQLLADYVHKKNGDVPIEGDTPFLVIQRIKRCLGEIRNLKKLLDRYGPYDQGYEAGAIIDLPTSSNDRATIPNPSTTKERVGRLPCHSCGITGHSKETCYFSTHPDANHSSVPWNESVVGGRWRAHGYTCFQAKVVLPNGDTNHTEGNVSGVGVEPTHHVHFETPDQPSRQKQQYRKRPASGYHAQMYPNQGQYPPYGGQLPLPTTISTTTTVRHVQLWSGSRGEQDPIFGALWSAS
jgi:hypothetical protein